jgi:hypothetical protein
MADIRINSLPTTASASSSDDFLALDGATNGTRKLNAYSPTFGGNLTVSGTSGVTTPLAYINNGTGNKYIDFYNASTGTTAIRVIDDASTVNAITFSKSAGVASVTIPNGNLTVSGAGTSSFGGQISIAGGAGSSAPVLVDYYGAIQAPGGVYVNSDITTARQAGFNSNGTDIRVRTGNVDGRAVFTSGGNFLLGTTTDGGQKLQVNGDATFAGDRVINRKDQNAVTRLQVRNDTSGTSGQAQIAATVGDFTTYTALGQLSAGFTSTGLYQANSGYLVGANALYIFTASSSSLVLGTNNTTALTINSSQAATFSGAVTVSSTTAGSAGAGALVVSGGLATGAASYFGGNLVVANNKFSNFDGSGAARMGMQSVSVAPYSVRMLGSADAVNTRDFSFGYYTGDNAANAWNQKAAINSYTGAATFAGAIAIGNTVQTASSVASTHKVTISIGGVTYYLLATNV